jgi:hypothetical protein
MSLFSTLLSKSNNAIGLALSSMVYTAYSAATIGMLQRGCNYEKGDIKLDMNIK